MLLFCQWISTRHRRLYMIKKAVTTKACLQSDVVGSAVPNHNKCEWTSPGALEGRHGRIGRILP